MTQNFDYEYVKGFFEQSGCILLESEYLNTKQPLKFQCSCGKISSKNFTQFQNNQLCRSCNMTIAAKKKREEKLLNAKKYLPKKI